MLLNIRVDYKIADIKTMEESYDKLDELNKKINQKIEVLEQVTLRTCNRYEIYLILKKDVQVPSTGFIVEKDDVAINHLLRLASGLESMIMGEDQILGQIKTARKKAIKEETIGPKLEKIFTKAIHVGQSVRKNTHINEGGVSVGSGAVELIEEKYGTLKGKEVLIIGAGEMGTVVSKALLEKEVRAIVVANRTYEKAVHLAKELSGYAIKFDKLNEKLKTADIVICATGAPHPIISKKRLEEINQAQLENMIMLDLANPRDISEDVRELKIPLYNLDDLRYITDKNKAKRELEEVKAEKIIEEEDILLKKALREQEIDPILSTMNIEAEKIRQNEISRTFNMLNLPENQEETIENLTHSIVDKLMFNIIKNLKQAASNNDEKTIASASNILIKYQKEE